MATKKPALGKGLSALLENAGTDVTRDAAVDGESELAGSISKISITKIEANPFQPRDHFEKEALIELADSIKQHGIIQPVTVRKMGYGEYQLISGERRLRASQIAGLKDIPAYVRIANDQTMLELALVENIQREDLDPIEVAISYQRLLDECDLTQEGLGEKVNKSRSAVANSLRLLKLPAEIQLALRNKKLTIGHARALINIDDTHQQMALFRQILDSEMSVRNVEELVRTQVKKTSSTTTQFISFEDQKVKDDLSTYLNTKIDLKKNEQGKGKLIISFNSEEEFQNILDKING